MSGRKYALPDPSGSLPLERLVSNRLASNTPEQVKAALLQYECRNPTASLAAQTSAGKAIAAWQTRYDATEKCFRDTFAPGWKDNVDAGIKRLGMHGDAEIGHTRELVRQLQLGGVPVYCIGDYSDRTIAMLAENGCTATRLPTTQLGRTGEPSVVLGVETVQSKAAVAGSMDFEAFDPDSVNLDDLSFDSSAFSSEAADRSLAAARDNVDTTDAVACEVLSSSLSAHMPWTTTRTMYATHGRFVSRQDFVTSVTAMARARGLATGLRPGPGKTVSDLNLAGRREVAFHVYGCGLVECLCLGPGPTDTGAAKEKVV